MYKCLQGYMQWNVVSLLSILKKLKRTNREVSCRSLIFNSAIHHFASDHHFLEDMVRKRPWKSIERQSRPCLQAHPHVIFVPYLEMFSSSTLLKYAMEKTIVIQVVSAFNCFCTFMAQTLYYLLQETVDLLIHYRTEPPVSFIVYVI